MHDGSAHGTVSDVTSVEQVPPHDAGVIVRIRDLLPGEHCPGSQWDQPDHIPTMQSIRPGLAVQDRSSDNVSGQEPPFVAGCVTVRMRVWVPAPQVAEQDVQSDQFERVQLVAHGPLLQGSVSSFTHALPPHSSFTTIAERYLVPLPHVTEQLDQSLQANMRQSLGQQNEAIEQRHCPVCRLRESKSASNADSRSCSFKSVRF